MITSDATDTALLTAEHATSTNRLSAAESAMARRSVRSYLEEAITDAEIHSLLELTGRAPRLSICSRGASSSCATRL